MYPAICEMRTPLAYFLGQVLTCYHSPLKREPHQQTGNGQHDGADADNVDIERQRPHAEPTLKDLREESKRTQNAQGHHPVDRDEVSNLGIRPGELYRYVLYSEESGGGVEREEEDSKEAKSKLTSGPSDTKGGCDGVCVVPERSEDPLWRALGCRLGVGRWCLGEDFRGGDALLRRQCLRHEQRHEDGGNQDGGAESKWQPEVFCEEPRSSRGHDDIADDGASAEQVEDGRSHILGGDVDNDRVHGGRQDAGAAADDEKGR